MSKVQRISKYIAVLGFIAYMFIVLSVHVQLNHPRHHADKPPGSDRPLAQRNYDVMITHDDVEENGDEPGTMEHRVQGEAVENRHLMYEENEIAESNNVTQKINADLDNIQQKLNEIEHLRNASSVGLHSNRSSRVTSSPRISRHQSAIKHKPYKKKESNSTTKAPPKSSQKKNLVNTWLSRETEHCDGKIKVYDKAVVVFSDLLLDTSACGDTLRGAENISDVMRQDEEREFLKLRRGCFQLDCGGEAVSLNTHMLKTNMPGHYANWISAVEYVDTMDTTHVTRYDKFTVAVVRYEYANVYWNVIDLYDIYLTAKLNNVAMNDTSVLIMDAHPLGHMDKWWKNTFHSVLRPAQLEKLTVFEKFSWLFGRHVSPLLSMATKEPAYWLDFRANVLAQSGISDDYRRTCPSQTQQDTPPKLRILLIWRRDYIAHPRNPTGLVMRKIKNEQELERTLKSHFPHFSIRAVQLDKLSIEEQLYLISHSDVMIGMHGAAMAFNVFMPPYSAVIELYPNYYKGYNWHMEYIAKWTGHSYKKWTNQNTALEDSKNGYTTIPPQTAIDLINEMSRKLCPT